MREYCYKKIDAFTSKHSCGNPAACIYLNRDQDLSEQDMQEIAKQHKGFVSEVVYCRLALEAEVELCYYSSECEVDFCGHGTIACLYSLIKESSGLIDKDEITIHTVRKGGLTVYNKIKQEDAIYITAPQPVYLGNSLPREVIAKYLGLNSSDIATEYPIDRINAGLTTLIVPVEGLSREITLYPDEKNLKKFCLDNEIDIILIFSQQVSEKSKFAHTRVFAPRFGYLEDPATGSGNSAFGYYMLKYGIWKGESIAIEQGGDNIVFNSVKLSTLEGRVLFGGSATDRIVGSYLI